MRQRNMHFGELKNFPQLDRILFRNIDSKDKLMLAAFYQVMRYIGCHGASTLGNFTKFQILQSAKLRWEKVDDGKITITIQILCTGQILPPLLSFRFSRQIAEKQKKLS